MKLVGVVGKGWLCDNAVAPVSDFAVRIDELLHHIVLAAGSSEYGCLGSGEEREFEGGESVHWSE